MSSPEYAEVRPARLADVPAIAKIHVDGWRVAYRGILPGQVLANLAADDLATRWIERIQAQENRTYVVEVGEQIVGWASFCPVKEMPLRRSELLGIYLKPDCWRRGYGSLLCRIGEKECRALGAAEILLWVLVRNYRARLFYQSQGYSWKGRLRRAEYGNESFLLLQYGKDLGTHPRSSNYPVSL